MSDFLRVCLIITLSFSICQTAGLYLIEGYLFTFTTNGILTTVVLFFTQIILIIILSSTKNGKTLKIFAIIITIIILLTFIIKIIIAANFIEHGRQMFHQLIKTYPGGEQPTDLTLILYYIFIKDEHCCGIDSKPSLGTSEAIYFYTKFFSNCISFGSHTASPQHRYHGKPCMNIVHDMYRLVITINLVQMFIISLVLILFWIYIFLRRGEQKQMTQSFISIPRNQMMIYPLNTSVYKPNSMTPPPAYENVR